MRPRRRSRSRLTEAQLWEAQRYRLIAIERAEIEPRYERERAFLRALRARGRPNPAHFILPGLLFLAEHARETPVAPPAAPPDSSH